MSDAKIKSAIKKLASDPNAELYSKPCEVVSVSNSKRTCVVQPFDGSAKIYNVRLQAAEANETGLFLKPKVGSSVIVTFLSKNFAFVSLTTDIDEVVLKCDKVTINDGTLGGVPISGKIAERLLRLEVQLQALCALFDAHTHLVILPVPSTPSAPPLPLASPIITPQLQPPTTPVYLEDTKVKH
jgi:hypothetical protein